LQPVHVDDVAAVIVKLLEAPPDTPSRILDLPGQRAMRYVEWLETYRRLMGLPVALHLPVPAFVMTATARLAGYFPASLLCRETWTMLKSGNCADAGPASALLERPLRDPATFAAPTAAEGLRLSALARWRRPLLMGVLAAIWFGTALVSAGLFPLQQSLALLAPFGLTGAAASFTLAAAVGLDTLMGLLTLIKPGRRLWWTQLALIGAYSLFIAWRLPEFLLHPFGPILKNLAVAALLLQLLAEEQKP
jgi:hypothetical protein